MKVLMLTDVDGWAWDIKAHQIKKNLPYDFVIKKAKDLSKKDFSEYDSIHSFNWMVGKNHEFMTSAISSHNYRILHAELSEKLIPKFSAISCVSSELFDLAKKNKINRNIYLCCNGVDEETFYPNTKKNNKKLVIGWVGQKTEGFLNKKPYDIKGYKNILKPIIDKFNLNNKIEFLVHSNNYSNAIPNSEMPNIYDKIDILISTSFLEGTPNSVFEAAASGIPVISTAVGCVPLLIKEGYNGALVPAYKDKDGVNKTIQTFIDKINFLLNNQDFIKIMGENNRKEIEESWTWRYRAKQWIPIFENHRVK